MSFFNNAYRRLPTNQSALFFHRKGVSPRYLVFGIITLLLIWTSWSQYLSKREYILWDPNWEIKQHDRELWSNRSEAVKGAFLHAYRGYEEHAWGKDEIRPVSNQSVNNFVGWGVTIVDSLDTMYLMGFKEDFEKATQFVANMTFDLPLGQFAHFFEVVIRYLGGLLSAHSLSQDAIFLDRAEALARVLMPAFNTTSGLPMYGTFAGKGMSRGDFSILAEVATCQLEYTYLAKHTGKREYWDLVDNIIKTLDKADVSKLGGMLPIRWNTETGKAADTHLSVGAESDSGQEYLLKQYLLTAKTDKASLMMYIRATTQVLANLLYVSPTRNLLYVTDVTTLIKEKHHPSHKLEHLSCFLPGLLALGAHTLPLNDLESVGVNFYDLSKGLDGDARADYERISHFNLKDLHMWAAEGLAQTCYLTYADQPSGLGPDEVIFDALPNKAMDPGKKGELWIHFLEAWKSSGSRGTPPGLKEMPPIVEAPKRDYTVRNSGYYLRPESVESFFLLWRVTGDIRWREYGWKVFEAIEKQAKTKSGYSNVRNVFTSPATPNDIMPSYFMAETLKYLYLLFTDEELVPLEKYVFNTEGHPLSTFEWTARERSDWEIV